MRSSVGSPAAPSSIKRAAGSLRGSAEYRPGWSVRITSASASSRLATSAPSVSLSPNLISSLTTVSFSLITGTTPSAEQRQQRRARVQVALAVGEVGVGQQHLGAADAVLAQRRFVDLRQAHLADRRGGLQLVDAVRPRRPAEPLHAFGDRAARDHHHLAPLRAPARPSAGTSCRRRRASTPRPSLVTRLEPTLTTIARARSRSAVAHRAPSRVDRRRSADRGIVGTRCATCAATCS